MREFLKQKLKSFLGWATRKVLAKFQPKIIGITGSVGKTSTKEAVFSVVSGKYRAAKSEKNYNNEFGLPFTILGLQSPEGSTVGWIGVIFKVLSCVFFTQKYPNVLVLEMGIDRPGDMDYLLSLTGAPHISVVTTIGMSHYEFFSSLEEIENEKGKIVEALTPEGTAILNADNEAALRQRSKTKAKVLTFGSAAGADVLLQNYSENLEGKFSSTFNIGKPNYEIQISIPAVGHTHASAVLAAVAVADVLGIEDSLVKSGLQSYRPAPGRLNIIAGIKRSVIIDDTYNAAPDSMREAVELLSRMPNSHKIAVLGDMLELGAGSGVAHQEIGQLVAQKNFDHLLTVGDEAKLIAEAAVAAGMSEDKILKFDSSTEAQKVVQEIMKSESVVLVKGSQGVRMEKITKEIMAEPMSAPDLLCRQDAYWLKS